MKNIIISLLLCLVTHTHAQQPLDTLAIQFDALAKEVPGLNERLISEVSGVNLATLISTIAYKHKITVEVDQSLTTPVEANYYDRPVKEIFLYLIQRHDLEVQFVRNVIIFNKKKVIVPPPKPPKSKKIDISYNKEEGLLSVNFKNDSILRVAEAITKLTNINVVVAPDLKEKLVSGYFQNKPFEDILNMIGQANDITVSKNRNKAFFLENDYALTDDSKNGNALKRKRQKKRFGEKGYYKVSIAENGFLIIEANEASASDIIKEVSELLDLNYYFYNKLENDLTTIKANEITFDELLNTIFRGKPYTYTKNNKGFYFIGKREQEGLRASKLIKLENRTVDSLLTFIPTELTKGLDVKEFNDLNGLVVSGSQPKITELEAYVQEIDQIVPMVRMEIYLIQYNKSHKIETGMQAGLDNTPKTTSGVLFPTTNVQMNAQSVNGLIDLFNGIGWASLGKVTQQFYLNLKFLENNSVIRMESTSKLAALNGHDAELKIGETAFYKVQNNTFTPLGNTNNLTQNINWNETEANLNIKITPQVSKDEQVTLVVTVEKSTFLPITEQGAPPGKSTQFFKTEIRIKNNEMAFLGGLDELKNDNSGTGVPLISRIPILKWIFGGRVKQKSKSRLHLLIKPIISY